MDNRRLRVEGDASPSYLTLTIKILSLWVISLYEKRKMQKISPEKQEYLDHRREKIERHRQRREEKRVSFKKFGVVKKQRNERNEKHISNLSSWLLRKIFRSSAILKKCSHISQKVEKSLSDDIRSTSISKISQVFRLMLLPS